MNCLPAEPKRAFQAVNPAQLGVAASVKLKPLAEYHRLSRRVQTSLFGY